MLDTLLTLIAIFYLGFQIGGFYTSFKLRHLIFRESAAKGIDVSKFVEPEEKTHLRLVIEHHQNCLYLFDAIHNVFICQGKTIEELAILAKRYKNITHALVLDSKTNNILTFKDGCVE